MYVTNNNSMFLLAVLLSVYATSQSSAFVIGTSTILSSSSSPLKSIERIVTTTTLKSSVVIDERDYWNNNEGRRTSSSLSSPSGGVVGKSYYQQQQNSIRVPSREKQTKITSLRHFHQYITADTEQQRYTVVKFYANWCKTCAKFGLKYDKLVAQHGSSNGQENNGHLRFASVEHTANSEIFHELGVEKLPTIHIYDAYGNKVVDMTCQPSKFQELVDQIDQVVTIYYDNNKTTRVVQSEQQQQQQGVVAEEDEEVEKELNLLQQKSLLYKQLNFAAQQLISSRVNNFKHGNSGWGI